MTNEPVASGDPRNVMKTIASIPWDFRGRLTASINDVDFDIVARNAIILLIAFTVDDVDQAVDCIIHVWYSAFLTPHHVDILRSTVRPLVDDVCVKVAGKAFDVTLGKTWTFDHGSLRLVLRKEQWDQLLRSFETPADRTAKLASEIRRAVTLAPERIDYRDRALFTKPGGQRLAATKFRDDGVLLSFGRSRAAFTEPNPTVFQEKEWPMMDCADPLDGWDHQEILATATGPATSDIYGKLFCHLHKLIRSFYERSRDLRVGFKLLNLDAKDLHTQLEDGKFARVEVSLLFVGSIWLSALTIRQMSNISDQWCLGPAGAVGHLSRFLQTPAANPHATLITLFLNAVQETMTPHEKQQDLGSELQLVLKYLPFTTPPLDPRDPRLHMCMEACSLVRDNDKYFEL